VAVYLCNYITIYTIYISVHLFLWVMSGVELESFSLCGGVYCGVVSGSDFSGASVLVLVLVFDCGMFFYPPNGMGKGG